MRNGSFSLELIKENIIKPSTPTPPSLKNYKLSLIDQLSPSLYTPVVLFFPKESFDTCNKNDYVLEKSLSELLTLYYPFAGRKVGGIFVECNDMGVIFREVRLINCSVSEILEKPLACVEDSVFPTGLPWDTNVPNGEGSLVVAQLSHFSCGGKALSLCLSHKLGDGATLFNFFNDWATTARNTTIKKPCPLFNGSIIYPPIESQNISEDYDLKNKQRHISTRITFGSSQINLLKSIATTSEAGVQNPTRIEVVTALLTKSVLSASMVDCPYFKPIVLFVVVNLRSRTKAPIQGNSVGNFITYLHIPIFSEQDMKFESLVAKIRSEKVKNHEKFEGLKEKELIEVAHEENKLLEELGNNKKVEFYSVTSMCGFPYQDMDFGWGKPINVSFPAIPKKNYFVLVNDQTGKGVEAIATLRGKSFEGSSERPRVYFFCYFTTPEQQMSMHDELLEDT